MINFRNIFNPNYVYIGVIIIVILAVLIYINNKDIELSMYNFSNSLLIASIINLIIGTILKYLMNNFVVFKYKIVIQIISDNLISSIYLYSIFGVVVSFFMFIIVKCFVKMGDIKAN